MSTEMRVIVYPAKDLAKSKALFSRLLGVEPYVDGSYYVGFRAGDLEFGLDPHGQGPGPIAYWDVADIRSSLQELLDAGAQAHQDVKDVGRGLLIATVKDADGNVLGLRQSP
ncbi:MAG: glyoxalase [Candidatus Nephthysia bennettiae]|uniref:Glyoxalase n=1 Tax=Candidatus Nephthysia bennettiae TaxID=3127016 RepID=A0A934N872_9BACT|nr:glyoxalase [Candidatus Dormibacteraeota bacterium]PZS00912.1 MAG: glyoxalase [Candidatus Dormibacteraeota bacterium]